MILVISDVHLGSPAFKKRKELTKLLSRKWDKIIINGDFLELLGFKTKEEILVEFKDIIDILSKNNTVKIRGNHDQKFGDRNSTEVLLSATKSIAIAHGHIQGGKTYSWAVKLNWIIYKLTGLEIRRLFNSFKSYDAMNMRAVEMFPGHDFIILGHSHKPGVTGKIINCGDMLEHSTYIEIANGLISLKELK